MKKIRVSKNDNVPCPRLNKIVPHQTCRVCEDLFAEQQGIGARIILCKRGGRAPDVFIEKSGNRRAEAAGKAEVNLPEFP